jgi:hypothetical protein
MGSWEFGFAALGLLLAAITAVEPGQKLLRNSWLRLFRSQRVQPTIAGRFVALFESHGVHRNQIPRFFGHGLSLQDVKDDQTLSAKLTDTHLDAACRLFAVRREWLEGADSQIYPLHDFYKHPEEVESFIATLRADNPDGQLRGELLSPANGGNAMLVLTEIVGEIGDRPVMRYHLCGEWVFDYWKSRACLTAFVATAWRLNAFISGRELTKASLQPMCAGETVLTRNGEPVWESEGTRWHPEDMALEPTAFLHGVDPEHNDHGIKEGLKLWLLLADRGFMRTGLGADKDVEAKLRFAKALDTANHANARSLHGFE